MSSCSGVVTRVYTTLTLEGDCFESRSCKAIEPTKGCQKSPEALAESK